MTNNLHFIDLFAGCGGLSLGLEQAGITPVYVNELNKDAMDSYLCNRIEENPLLNKYKSYDIKELSEKTDIKKLIEDITKDYSINDKKFPIDLIVGGPPCQGFSMIGHRRSYNVSRNKLMPNFLYKEMAKVIKKVNPKMFLFENVQGLLSAKWDKDGEKGEIWEDVLSTFTNETGNYEVKHLKVYSKEYGVPQNRPRVFIIGINKKLNYEFNDDLRASGLLPEPIAEAPPHLYDLLSDLIDKNYKKELSTKKYPLKPTNDLQKNLRIYRNKTLSDLTDHDYSKHSDHIEKKFTYMIENQLDHTAGNSKLPEEFITNKFRQKLLPKFWDENGPSITVTSLPDDFVHFSQPRSLSVREWARIQTFPDWYQFRGPRTTGGLRRAGNPKENDFKRELPKYTQIGNAVPVKLAYEIGKHFSNVISKYYGNHK